MTEITVNGAHSQVVPLVAGRTVFKRRPVCVIVQLHDSMDATVPVWDQPGRSERVILSRVQLMAAGVHGLVILGVLKHAKVAVVSAIEGAIVQSLNTAVGIARPSRGSHASSVICVTRNCVQVCVNLREEEVLVEMHVKLQHYREQKILWVSWIEF